MFVHVLSCGIKMSSYREHFLILQERGRSVTFLLKACFLGRTVMTDPAVTPSACWAVGSSLRFRTMALRGKPVIAKGQTLTLENV